MPKPKETEPRSALPFSPSRDTGRTVEVHCGNCCARFVAFYGTEEDAGTETVNTEKYGLYDGDALKNDNSRFRSLMV